MMLKYFILLSTIILIANFNIVNAETVTIPDWIFIVYDFWIENKISDEDFIAMLNYLEESDIIDLIFHREYDVKTNFLLSVMSEPDSRYYSSCGYGWYVTGYFVPIEADYSGKFIQIYFNNSPREFKEDFVDTVKIEGWGRTLSGDYLGWYDNSFHLNKYPLDSTGNILTVGTIAVDTEKIESGDELIISTLPEPWNEIVFIASDEGPSIIGKHIDLFTGEGKLAEKETFRITSHNNKLCR